MRHGYSHDTRGDGVTVVKRYGGPGAAVRARTERAALVALAGRLPVPHVLPSLGAAGNGDEGDGGEGGRNEGARDEGARDEGVRDEGGGNPGGGSELVMGHVAGVHGQELVEQGSAAGVLSSCGVMLRRIQAVVIEGVRPGTVLVHGDYGPNNMLFEAATFAVAAVLDWEWAHAGDPVEDLAWCEWIVRMHHPGEVAALGALFDGYGWRPRWEERQRWRIARCRELIRLVDGDAAALWRERLAITEGWRE